MTGNGFEDQLAYLINVIRIEGYDDETLQQCKDLFKKYTNYSRQENHEGSDTSVFSSLVRKYATSRAVSFPSHMVKRAVESITK